MTINAIDLIIPSRETSLGSFTVKRVLPFAKRRAVGPFIFLDHMGPHVFAPGLGLSVAPHPHIGLSTLTYLLEGRIIHRDSLGSVAEIHPGAVNWMTAGSGIAHSERSAEADLDGEHRLNGLQLWIALPDDQEDCAPTFSHYPKATLPRLKLGECDCTVVAGTMQGKSSPVRTHSPLFFADVLAPTNSHFAFDPDGHEIAVYIAQGASQISGQDVFAGQMVVLKSGSALQFRASLDTRAFVLGGEKLGREKHMWWNFVSSNREKIETAKRRWENDEYPPIPGESRFSRTPLPSA